MKKNTLNFKTDLLHIIFNLDDFSKSEVIKNNTKIKIFINNNYCNSFKKDSNTIFIGNNKNNYISKYSLFYNVFLRDLKELFLIRY